MKTKQKNRNSFIWNNIKIEYVFDKVTYPNICHISVYCDEEIPITETGYRSIFDGEENINSYGGVEKYLIAFLNEKAKNINWKKSVVKKQQLSLF